MMTDKPRESERGLFNGLARLMTAIQQGALTDGEWKVLVKQLIKVGLRPDEIARIVVLVMAEKGRLIDLAREEKEDDDDDD
jgi:hypothetical protein